MPAGQGGYLAGVAAGFEAISRTRGVPMPRMIGVQSMNCRPLVRAFDDKREHSTAWTEPLGPSLAANVAWAMVAPSVDWIEVPYLPAGQRFPGPWTQPALVDGAVPYPTGPGLSWVT